LALQIYNDFEPTHYVVGIAPRPLIMVNGWNDPQMPVQAVQALYTAAREPKTLIWLTTGHLLPTDKTLIRALVRYNARPAPGAGDREFGRRAEEPALISRSRGGRRRIRRSRRKQVSMLRVLTNPLCYVPAGRDDPHSLLTSVSEGRLDQLPANATTPL
jgi:fermentation-respiration switch protein FrsA (DUF1100 family)